MVQVTVETTGTLLVAADVAAAAPVLKALDVPIVGLNCATGPQERAPQLECPAGDRPGLLSVPPHPRLPALVAALSPHTLRAQAPAGRAGRSPSEPAEPSP